MVADSTSNDSPVPGSSPPSKSSYLLPTEPNGVAPLNGHTVPLGHTSSYGSAALPKGCSLPNGNAAVALADVSVTVKANGAGSVASFPAVEVHNGDGHAIGEAARANGIAHRQSEVVGGRFARFGDEELVYEKLPKDIADRHVLLMDPILGAGSSAIRAIQVQPQYWPAYGTPCSHCLTVQALSVTGWITVAGDVRSWVRGSWGSLMNLSNAGCSSQSVFVLHTRC